MEKKQIVGIDLGAETIKVVGVEQNGNGLTCSKREIREHFKNPEGVLGDILSDWNWSHVDFAAVCGRLSRNVNLARVPMKQAQAAAFRHLFPETDSGTVVSIGSHGFSVLELRTAAGDLGEMEVFRENSRCSQGTGNFLRQLVGRFDLSIDDASALCDTVDDPAPLSGRCPVILKTDMTHLANKGEPRGRILAGLYDAVCENVQVLIKPRVGPSKHILIGGVSRSRRIQDNFRRFLGQHEMELMDIKLDDAIFFEALGAAVTAAERQSPTPALKKLFNDPDDHPLETLPPLSSFLSKVQRLKGKSLPKSRRNLDALILGYDIGSTGSKLVALDPERKEPVWQGYTGTNGAPVVAAQQLTEQFLESPFADTDVVAVGATGSGREIVGSLMTTCFGAGNVFVLNEIAAHAEGALHHDARVDTIFEIGGQDAKYIRLAEGRVVDAAMNEACSAGTGSFIEEQGKKFHKVKDVVHLGKTALKAERGISLGQHCSVFMAEIIDEAVAAGEHQSSIIAGIYDSIIQNYLNRVKGNRSVGKYVFCQGMPFSSDALAAAVARQTGSEVIVPPNPGTIGALGIALLTVKERSLEQTESLEMKRFLEASVTQKDVFVCNSTKGCNEPGNKCRIDRIQTVVDSKKQRFTWGGGCSLYDKGTGKKKLPDRAPDPFRERENLVTELLGQLEEHSGRPTVAITDEFTLKGLFPFFATFIHELGLNLSFHTGATQATLKRGIEDANVPFCAPMQQYHGLVSKMAAEDVDYIFLPMLRQLPRVNGEDWARLCPIVQGSADILKKDLGEHTRGKIVSPVINVGQESLESDIFLDSCEALARELGVSDERWRSAHRLAIAAQYAFDGQCTELGHNALEYCEEHGITPVVVLGRAYTIYNTVLNSNVPAILREQGTIPIPVDCYPIGDGVPIFERMYWGYGQRNLRAIYDIRRKPGVYSLYCSNYSCGPDSFTIHFYSYLMEGKPYSVIETDGHSGDAGTKTRVEAFLYCVNEDSKKAQPPALLRTIDDLEHGSKPVEDIVEHGDVLLIPRMGDGTEALVTCMRGIGLRAEALPIPTRDTLNRGRRYTSGKECIPMTLTLGALLERIESEKNEDTKFTFFMPTANGPCRFGAYHLLHNIVLEQLGLKNKVSFWSPIDEGYFDAAPDGFPGLIFTGFVASDLLQLMLLDTRPVENQPGIAEEIYEYYHAELLTLLEEKSTQKLNNSIMLTQGLTGQLFGVTSLLTRAAQTFAGIKTHAVVPTVLVVGEIYVRSDPFSNDFVIKKLEERGIRARFAVFSEWIEYTDYQDVKKLSAPDYISSFLQASIQNNLYEAVADVLGWADRTTVQDSLQAAAPYIREQLSGEAVLTLGGPVHEWRHGHIDGVVSVGPLECMPNKIAESQFFHVAENEGLRSLTLNLNGDPIDPEILDNFAYEVHAGHRRRQEGRATIPPPTNPRAPMWKASSRVNHHQ